MQIGGFGRYLRKCCVYSLLFTVALFYLAACDRLQPLNIVDFGPQDIRANVPFNVQKDGQSALWIKMNRNVADKTYVMINGVRLNSYSNANVVTLTVPSAL